jgi:protein-S-isoprenylcysteine O-methyltransferase Ste14
MAELKEKGGEHPLGDAGQLVLFVLFVAVWVIDSFFLGFSTHPAMWVPVLLRLVLAGVTLVAAVMLVRAAHTVMDHGSEPRRLVTTGAFGRVRHPLYLGCILFYLGLVLATLSIASAAVFVVIILFYDYIARYEEKLLLGRFGEEYERYRERSGRWLPPMG